MSTSPLWPDFAGIKNFSQNFTFPKLTADFVPCVDIYQNDQQVIVAAQLPGLTEQDTLSVQVTAESIVIRGELKRDKTLESEQCCHQECFQGSFVRVLSLPAPVYAEQAIANYENGVLTITAPKQKNISSQDLNLTVHFPRGTAK